MLKQNFCVPAAEKILFMQKRYCIRLETSEKVCQHIEKMSAVEILCEEHVHKLETFFTEPRGKGYFVA